MRKILFTSFVAGMLAVFMAVSGAQTQKSMPSGKKVTIEGELIDLRCYSMMGALGEGHGVCANMCVKAGDPVGILDSKGNVYTLGAIAQGFNGNMAKTARISGMLFGNVLIPENVEVKDGSKWTKVKLAKEMM